MTYYEITKKMKDLTMTPSDWSWLSKYLIETGSAHVYSELVNAYQEREAGRLPICVIGCNHDFGLCRYCRGFRFECGYKGFCSHQRKASWLWPKGAEDSSFLVNFSLGFWYNIFVLNNKERSIWKFLSFLACSLEWQLLRLIFHLVSTFAASSMQ